MRLSIKLCLSALAAVSAYSQGSEQWLYVATGANAAAVQSEVDRFRRDLGNLNPNEPSSFPAGRREINWDAVGGTLGNDNLPGDFFHKTSPRGLLMSTPGLRFKVSGDRGTPSFNMRDVTRDEWGMDEFAAFSGDKFFAPMGSNVTDVEFRVPGTDDVACVSGFGVVFMDIDRGGQTSMRVKLTDGTVRSFTAPLQPVRSKGLSFVGVRFASACILSVRLTNGDHPVDTPDIPSPFPDGVGMDDFIYGEPAAVVRGGY